MSEMTPPPLPEDSGDRSTPLDYRSAGMGAPAREQRGSFRGFFGGLLLGTGLSAILWALQFTESLAHGLGLLVVLVPAAKLGAGIMGLCLHGWRAFGAGMLVSIALGILIFLECARLRRLRTERFAARGTSVSQLKNRCESANGRRANPVKLRRCRLWAPAGRSALGFARIHSLSLVLGGGGAGVRGRIASCAPLS